ncbi:MAG: TIGR03663 family protein [Archaeoglobus sp.]|uniref:flippase activity-associated protein Agl23 n=1 Tax=Archaeoglobus sp. TaxID=1872626 RepID=UPI001D88BA11|nr:flippase activity-associated protein Agl23 [Archaeoglobus sp.]MBO8179253.1 TIGR03663 family protein [Archaeoglobus sp.]
MRKTIPIIAVVIIAALMRLYNLSLPPLFFDESIHATILKSLFNGNYKYDPAYHGPLLYYLLYVPVQTLGESEFSLRILPALTGIVVSLTPFLYRRFIGDDAAVIAAILVAISAIIVNYSRFCRADIFQLLFTALFAYFIFRYLEKEKSLTDLRVDKDTLFLAAAFVFMALFATLKETFYPIAAIFALYFIFDIKKFRVSDLAISLAVFLLVYFAFYTNLFTYTTPLTNFSEFPAVKAVSYWKYQHEIARIAGPWYYYLELILLYDLPAFLLAIFAVYTIITQRKEFEAFAAYWFLSSLIFFSYMQEKVPWLNVHILFPMYLLAGIGISRLASRIDRQKLKCVVVICILFSAYGSVHVNHINPVNPAEPALYLPTQYDVREFAEKTKNETVYVFTSIGEYWPLAWYLKDHKAYFISASVEGRMFEEGDYIIVNTTNDMRLDKTNLEFVETMVVRCWTFWTQPDISRVPEFLVFRGPLTDVSCMNFSVYRTK